MLIVFLLSLHLLLLSIYGLFIEQKVSRLQSEYLFWAICLPFVGELCLLIAEAGDFQTAQIYKSPLTVEETELAVDAQQVINFAESQIITREYLLDAIKKKPSNLIELLKVALSSDDVEVAHIAAANIMRIQRGYEADIKTSEREYRLLEDDMCLLRKYIKSIDNYLSSNLLEGELLSQMRETQLSLLDVYIAKMPGDYEANTLLQEVRLQLGKN